MKLKCSYFGGNPFLVSLSCIVWLKVAPLTKISDLLSPFEQFAQTYRTKFGSFRRWRFGAYSSALVFINDVNLCRARLVLGWPLGDRVWV